MIDNIANTVARQVAKTINDYTQIEIDIRYQPDFNFSAAYTQALSIDKVKQAIIENKAYILGIYEREALRTSDPSVGGRNAAARVVRFDSNTDKVSIEKGLMTGSFYMNFRIGCPSRDIIENIELTYFYTLKKMSHIIVEVSMDDCKDDLSLFYATSFSDSTEMSFLDYQSNGCMYVFSFTIDVTGDFFTPQSKYVVKQDKINTNLFINREKYLELTSKKY